MNKTLAGIVFGIGFGLVANTLDTPEQPIDRTRIEAQVRLEEYIQDYGYGIPSKTSSDQRATEERYISRVEVYTIGGDTLERLATVFYRDEKKWRTLADTNPTQFRGYKPNDKLPPGLTVVTTMFSFQLRMFRDDFPERRIIVINPTKESLD